MLSAAEIIKQRTLLYGIKGVDEITSIPFYRVIKIEKRKHQAFKKTLESKNNFYLNDFGEILFSQIEPPSEALIAEWKDKFDLDLSSWINTAAS